MATLGQVLGDSLKKLFFREIVATRVSDISAHFRRLDFAGAALEAVRFSVGDKVQVAFEGGPRTYTPFSFDAQRGALSLLSYLHADGPSARWAKGLVPGDRVHVFGPRRSLALEAASEQLVLFGDETSFALARALLDARGSAQGLRFIFEATQRAEALGVLDALGVPSDGLVERRDDESHLLAVEERLRAAVTAESRLVLTGKAQSIQALRKGLKIRPAAHAGQIVKAYWSPGKRGLD